MSFVGDMFSGAKGAGFQAQGVSGGALNPNLLQTTNQNQLDTSYGQANDAIKQQQAFVNALQAQGGIQNQSNVFSQQQALANQMQGLANGTGPNPAQAALAQATGANVANQSALMAGQRGAGSNVGMMARQAGQQGGALQQQAAGQGATMQAQQQIAGMQALQGQQANMANLSTNQVGQQAGALGGLNQYSQGEQSILQQAAAARNAADVQMQMNINNTMAGNAQSNQGFQQGMFSQLTSAAGKGAGMGGVPKGYDGGLIKDGQVKRYADGGMSTAAPQVQVLPQNQPGAQVAAPKRSPIQDHVDDLAGLSDSKSPNVQAGLKAGQGMADIFGGLAGRLKGSSSSPSDATPTASSSEDMINSMGGGAKGTTPYISSGQAMEDAMRMALGGRVPALVSPGEVYLPPKDAQEVYKGKKNPMSGEKIKGKAKVKGDNLKNDIVPKTLEEGGIVIPRSIVNSPDAVKHAIKFVRAHLSSLKK